MQTAIFIVTVKDIIQRLEALKNIPIDRSKDEVENCFNRYSYEGVDELTGFDKWGDISKDGKYQLSIKIDHEDAYDFTIYVEVTDAQVSVYNVL